MEKIKIKKFLDFINENENVVKFYMLVDKPYYSDTVLGKMITDARNSLFQQIVIRPNVKIEKNVPVLNFTENFSLLKDLVKKGSIDKKCLYNQPEESQLVSDKVSFHEIFEGKKYVPKTVFSLKEALKLKFPIVAKPAKGKSAEGIRKFETPEELKESKEKFDLYSEAIKIEKEYRCFCFREDVMELNQRIPQKDSEDFLKKSSTKTDFVYKNLSMENFELKDELKRILASCRNSIKLDFFSVDFAVTPEKKIFVIEMNSRTGMGVEKMIELYEKIHLDFFKKFPSQEAEKEFKSLKSEWKEKYKEEKMNECTTVAGNIGKVQFLFKNRDRSFTPESTIVHEKANGTEIVYYSDQTGWIEGMNEHGVGFVFSQLTEKSYKGYSPTYFISDDPKNDSKFKPFADGVKKILTAKNADEAIKHLLSSEKSGSFLIGDEKTIYEVEVFKGKVEQRKLEFSDSYYVKTNHGSLIPDAGHQPSGDSIKRASSSIRKHQANVQLMGIQDISEIPARMKFQAFDTLSSLNTFRTDPEEYTISQCLMDLTNLKFYFFHDTMTADSVKRDSSVKNSKISVEIRKI